MPEDKYKNIPTLDVPVLEDVVTHGKAKNTAQPTAEENIQTDTPVTISKTKRNPDDRRKNDRRKKRMAIPEGKTNQRVSQRRRSTRRSDDKRINEEIDILAKKIMQDMMPNLEQYLLMQLRFELLKYVPKIFNELKDKDGE